MTFKVCIANCGNVYQFLINMATNKHGQDLDREYFEINSKVNYYQNFVILIRLKLNIFKFCLKFLEPLGIRNTDVNFNVTQFFSLRKQFWVPASNGSLLHYIYNKLVYVLGTQEKSYFDILAYEELRQLLKCIRIIVNSREWRFKNFRIIAELQLSISRWLDAWSKGREFNSNLSL